MPFNDLNYFRKGKRGRIIIWGEEYFVIPRSFLELMKLHCYKNCALENSTVGGRVGNFLNDARMKGKSSAKVRNRTKTFL